MHCVIWWHKIKFPTLYTKHMALKVYCGLWCCISCFSDIQRKKWQRLHFREEETERLNLWHGRGTESWAISLQGEPLSLFGGWIRFWEAKATQVRRKKSEKIRREEGERKLKWQGLRLWGERCDRGCSRGRDQVIFHHYMDNGGWGRCGKAIRKAMMERQSKSLKETVNTWVCCAGPERERSSNKQMIFLIPLCDAKVCRGSPGTLRPGCEQCNVCVCAFLYNLATLLTVCINRKVRSFCVWLGNLNARVSVWDWL